MATKLLRFLVFVWSSQFFCNLLVHSANVLAVFPSVWKSHYLYGRSLMQQLLLLQSADNHTVTLISPYGGDGDGDNGDGGVMDGDNKTMLPHNMHEIRVTGLHANWLEMGLSFNVEQMRQKSLMERFTRLIYAGATNVDLLLSDVQVRELLNSAQQFDLLVVDLFLSDALLGLAYFYNVPTVVVSPTGANAWLNQMTGNPQSSALDPSNFLPYAERMSLWQRSMNTLMYIFEKLTYNFFHMISQQSVYVKHFQHLCLQRHQRCNNSSSLLPHHRDLTKNLSLVLINSHPIVQYPRAYLPNMIEIGGAHLKRNASELQLPPHLERFIAESVNGVIYMSLGANLRTADLAREKLDILLHVFSSLQSMRVLLKWEEEDFDYPRASNIFLSAWFPQQAVLAHPNVKIFISTAGLMSLMEAIHFETPLLVLPINPEQQVAAQRVEQAGGALVLPFDTLNYDALLQALTELCNNHTYVKSIRELSFLLSSSNIAAGTPSTRALQYMQLILRTRGAAHLKSHANQLSFYSSELLDVLLILVAGIACIIAVPFVLTCCILRRSYYSHLSARSYRPSQSGVGGGGGRGGGGEAPLLLLHGRRRSSTSVSSRSTSSCDNGKLRHAVTNKRCSSQTPK